MDVVKKLGIVVSADGIAQTTTSLKAVAGAADQAAKSGEKVTSTYRQMFAQAQAEVAAMDRARKAVLAHADALEIDRARTESLAASARRMALLQAEAIAMNNAMGKSAVAAGEAGRLGINKIGNSLENMAGSALRANGALTNIAGELLEFGVGGPVAIAVLGGVAAMAIAYNKLTEGARAAARAQDEAVKALRDFNDQQRGGIGGKLAEQIDLARAAAERLRKELENPLRTVASSPGLAASTLLDLLLSGGNIAAVMGRLSANLGGQFARAEGAATQGEANRILQFEQITRAMTDQIERQHALNAALGKGELAIDLINNRYDYYNTLLKNSVGLSHEQATQLNALALAQKKVADETAILNDKFRDNVDLQKKITDGINRIRDAAAKRDEAAINFNPIAAPYTPKYITGDFGSDADDPNSVANRMARGAQKYKEEVERANAAVHDQTRAIEQSVRGAVQLGEAFGFVSREVSQIVQGLGQAYAGIGPLQAALKAGGALGIVGAALPVAGGIAAAVSGFMDAARQHQAAAKATQMAAESFRASLQQWAAEGLGQAQQDLASTMERRRKEFASRGFSEQDTARIRAIDLADFVNVPAVQNMLAKQKALVAEIDALYAATIERFKNEYLRSLEQQFNETRGPLGEFQNGLDGLMRWYREQQDTITALNLGMEERAKVEAILIERNKDLVEQYRRAAEAIYQIARDANANALTSRAGSMGLLGTFNRLGTYTWTDAGGNTSTVAPTKEQELFQDFLDGIERTKAIAEAQRQLQEFNNAQQQEEIQIAQDQLRAQEQMANSTRQTFEALRSYRDGLLVGPTSPLSPVNRFHESQRQFRTIGALAAGGDASALSSLRGVGDRYIEESINMYASGQGSTDAFDEVRDLVSGLTDKYGVQLTTEERMLAELQKSNATLQALDDTARQSLHAQEVTMLRAKIGAGVGSDFDRYLLATLDIWGNATIADITRTYQEAIAARNESYATGENMNLGNTEEEQRANAAAGWVWDPGSRTWRNPNTGQNYGDVFGGGGSGSSGQAVAALVRLEQRMVAIEGAISTAAAAMVSQSRRN